MILRVTCFSRTVWICVDLLRIDPGSNSETCLLSLDGENHGTGVKVEEVRDTEEEEDPQLITF